MGSNLIIRQASVINILKYIHFFDDLLIQYHQISLA